MIILLTAFLIAFGIIMIYFAAEQGFSDQKTALILALGFCCIVAGIWLILPEITIGLIIRRAAGVIFGFIGLFMIIGFPDVTKNYQTIEFTKTGIFIGLFLVILAVYLLFF